MSTDFEPPEPKKAKRQDRGFVATDPVTLGLLTRYAKAYGVSNGMMITSLVAYHHKHNAILLVDRLNACGCGEQPKAFSDKTGIYVHCVCGEGTSAYSETDVEQGMVKAEREWNRK